METMERTPLVFLDIESTGVNPETDRIIELCIIRVDYKDEQRTSTRRMNPGIPIPEGATAIHGITDDDVKDLPAFKSYARAILNLIEGCDLVAFGGLHFDFPILRKEFERVGIQWDYRQHQLIDVGNLFKIMEPRTLGAALRYYIGQDLPDAHSAEADTDAVFKVFWAMVGRYQDDTNFPKKLAHLARFSNYGKEVLDLSGKFTYNDAGDIILNFGKHRGEPAKDHLDFVQWMWSKDFASDTLEICEELLHKRPEPEAQPEPDYWLDEPKPDDTRGDFYGEGDFHDKDMGAR